MARAVWSFDNGVKLYRDQLLADQIERYRERNLHEPEETEIFLSVLANYDGTGVFLDVGAAAGYYSLLARRTIPDLEIHAFNPHPRFRAMMRDNMALNGLQGIRIHAVAISGVPGTFTLDDGWGSGIHKGENRLRGWLAKHLEPVLSSAAPSSPSDRLDVEAVTLQQLSASLAADIYLMKMDIQGEEARALAGAGDALVRFRHVIVGTHGAAIHGRCLRILRNRGFSILYEQNIVPHQPDGLIVATSPGR